MRRLVTHLYCWSLFCWWAHPASTPSIDFSAGRYNNVCKSLHNDVLFILYLWIARTTYPWSEFDILTTIDSIKLAAHWLEKEAKALGIPLHIKTDFYIGDEYTTDSEKSSTKQCE